MNKDESFIPCSTWINVDIKSKKATSDTDAFKALQKTNEDLVAKVKKKLKQNIPLSISIEIQQRITNFTNMIVQGVHVCCQIAIIENEETPDHENECVRQTFTALMPSITETTDLTDTLMLAALNDKFPNNMQDQSQSQNQQPANVKNNCADATVERARELSSALFIIPARKWKEAKRTQEMRNKL